MPARTARLLAALAALALPLGALTGTPAYAAPVALSSCVDPDNGDPVVTSAALSRTSADTTEGPATVDLVVTAGDTGGPGAASGVATITAQLWGPAGYGPENPVEMTTDGSGTWRAGLSVPRGSTPGTFRPHLVVTDVAGNGVLYGEGTGHPVPGDPVLGITSVPDRTAPRLARLTLGATDVDTRRHAARVTVTARVKDGRAGVTRVLVTAGGGRRSAMAFLQRVSGTVNDGAWRGTLVVPRYLGRVTWHVGNVAVVDGVVNVRRYPAKRLAALDRTRRVDRVLHVRSRTDRHRPSAASPSMSVSGVDVTAGDRSVVFRVRARDAAAGVAGVRLRLLDPGHSDGAFDTELSLLSGTRRAGVWGATVTVPRCGSVAGLWQSQLKVTDRAKRTRHYLSGQPTLQVSAPDNLVPRVVRTTTADNRVVLDVDEDVTGITPTSAPVHALADGSQVVGTWTCADAAGVAVPCATGALRKAVFTPHPTFAAVGQLVVVLNPEHSLGITDLAGNPVGRRYSL